MSLSTSMDGISREAVLYVTVELEVGDSLGSWQELLLADRLEEAMEEVLNRLRVAEVVSWPWPSITGSVAAGATAAVFSAAGLLRHPLGEALAQFSLSPDNSP